MVIFAIPKQISINNLKNKTMSSTYEFNPDHLCWIDYPEESYKTDEEKAIVAAIDNTIHTEIYNAIKDKKIEGISDVCLILGTPKSRYYKIEIVARGDWKHTHARLDWAMKDLGYEATKEQEIGYSDSDWYESVHCYRILKKQKPINKG